MPVSGRGVVRPSGRIVTACGVGAGRVYNQAGACPSECEEEPEPPTVAEKSFFDAGFIGGGQNGAFRTYEHPNDVPASPWFYSFTGNQLFLRVAWEDDAICRGYNSNDQSARADITLDVPSTMIVAFDAGGEGTIGVSLGPEDDWIVEVAGAPQQELIHNIVGPDGPFPTCASGLGAMRTWHNNAETGTRYIVLKPGLNTIRVRLTRGSEWIHGDYYFFRATFNAVVQTGACCYPDLSCSQLPVFHEPQCVLSGGRWLGAGTSCAGNPCIGENGSCCLPDGRCFEGVTEERCRVLANYDPSYVFNLGGACSDCFGACCLPNGAGCINLSKAACLALGGQFRRIYPAVPNPCAAHGPCSPPDPACCSGSSCNLCFIPPGVTVPATVNVTLSADFWRTPTGGSCAFQEALVAGEENGNIDLNSEPVNSTCAYQTNSASTQLTRAGAPNLTASVQFKSCSEGGRGPHLIVFSSAGGTTLHDVPCGGGSVVVNRADFGQPCGSSRQWRNIQIQATASIPLARACGGAARPSRVLVPGIDFIAGAGINAAIASSSGGGGGCSGPVPCGHGQRRTRR